MKNENRAADLNNANGSSVSKLTLSLCELHTTFVLQKNYLLKRY